MPMQLTGKDRSEIKNIQRMLHCHSPNRTSFEAHIDTSHFYYKLEKREKTCETSFWLTLSNWHIINYKEIRLSVKHLNMESSRV